MNLNQNIQTLQLTLPASGSPSAPVTGEIHLVDNVLLEFWVWASAAGGYFRLEDIETNIAPVFGWLPAPASPLNPEMEREISGPPWVIKVQAYNSTATEITFFLVIAIGNSREKDTQYQIMQEIEATRKLLENKFLGVPLNEPPEA